MRTKTEIWDNYPSYAYDEPPEVKAMECLLEVLLDIRELLLEERRSRR